MEQRPVSRPILSSSCYLCDCSGIGRCARLMTPEPSDNHAERADPYHWSLLVFPCQLHVCYHLTSHCSSVSAAASHDSQAREQRLHPRIVLHSGIHSPLPPADRTSSREQWNTCIRRVRRARVGGPSITSTRGQASERREDRDGDLAAPTAAAPTAPPGRGFPFDS